MEALCQYVKGEPQIPASEPPTRGFSPLTILQTFEGWACLPLAPLPKELWVMLTKVRPSVLSLMSPPSQLSHRRYNQSVLQVCVPQSCPGEHQRSMHSTTHMLIYEDWVKFLSIHGFCSCRYYYGTLPPHQKEPVSCFPSS